MALFFDSGWFDARLSQLGLSRAALAAALGLDDAALAEMWKDQREVTADHVRVMAALLGVSSAEIATRAGVSTPLPRDADDIERRLARIEAELAEIKALLKARRG
jgi:transcriptional regulator with XRE-family HTH domain